MIKLKMQINKRTKENKELKLGYNKLIAVHKENLKLIGNMLQEANVGNVIAEADLDGVRNVASKRIKNSRENQGKSMEFEGSNYFSMGNNYGLGPLSPVNNEGKSEDNVNEKEGNECKENENEEIKDMSKNEDDGNIIPPIINHNQTSKEKGKNYKKIPVNATKLSVGKSNEYENTNNSNNNSQNYKTNYKTKYKAKCYSTNNSAIAFNYLDEEKAENRMKENSEVKFPGIEFVSKSTLKKAKEQYITQRLKIEIFTLRNQLKEKDKVISVLKSAAKVSKYKELDTRYSKLYKECLSHKEKIQNYLVMEGEYFELKERESEILERVNNIEKENDKLRSKLEEYVGRAKKEEKDKINARLVKKDYDQKLSILKNENERLKSKLKQLEEKVSKSNDELLTLRETEAKVAKQFEAENEKKKLRKKISILEAKAKEMREKYTAKEAENARLSAKIVKLKQEIVSLKNKIKIMGGAKKQDEDLLFITRQVEKISGVEEKKSKVFTSEVNEEIEKAKDEVNPPKNQAANKSIEEITSPKKDENANKQSNKKPNDKQINTEDEFKIFAESSIKNSNNLDSNISNNILTVKDVHKSLENKSKHHTESDYYNEFNESNLKNIKSDISNEFTGGKNN